MARAFAGIRVVDFTQVISGPYATYQLAAMGADVIKLEQPGTGDQGRVMVAPTAHAKAVRMSALFTAVNGGKRSLTLNLKHPRARPVVEKLVADADVVIENFKAGTMAKLGFDYPTLKAVNDKIVYCSISGFGQTGPRAGAAAYDPVLQAGSGMMAVTGYPDTGPTKVGYWVCDMSTGLHAAFAIAGALLRRATSGEGCYLDVSMLDTAVSSMAPMVSMVLNYGVEPQPTGNGAPGAGGASTVYPTKDGHITVAAATDGQFVKLVTELGLGAYADDPRFTTREARLANSAAYRELVIPAFAQDTAANWEKRLAGIGVPAGKVLAVSEVPESAQVRHREQIQSVPTPMGLEGAFSAINLGFKVDRDGPRITRQPPGLGEHSNEVLTELGYSEDAIASLRNEGVI